MPPKEKELEIFYNSKKWRKTSKAYYDSRMGMCEQCGMACNKGEYNVDHTVDLTVKNYKNFDIAYSFENLKLLCIKCHNEKHERFLSTKKVNFDEEGEVIF